MQFIVNKISLNIIFRGEGRGVPSVPEMDYLSSYRHRKRFFVDT